jgi:hypothetical protein
MFAIVPPESPALALSLGGDDLLAGKRARVGNVKNNDPSLIEPIAGAG